MMVFKYNFFFLLFIFPAFVLQAQKVKSTQAVLLLNNSYVCRACEASFVKPTITSLNKEIASEQTLESAAKKIARHFTAPGDHFVLFCKSCPGKQMLGYPVKSSNQPKLSLKGFGTYIYSRPILQQQGSTKGGSVFYNFSEIIDYLSQGLLLFDSIELSTTAIINHNKVDYGTLRIFFDYKGTAIEREIPYDVEKKSYLINYQILFGNKLTRETTDSLHIGISYQQENGEIVRLPDVFKLYFANDVEKEDLAALFTMYKIALPEWPADSIARQLKLLVLAKYKAVSPDNFNEWLQKIK